jgi:transcription antitermination factor NusG
LAQRWPHVQNMVWADNCVKRRIERQTRLTFLI